MTEKKAAFTLIELLIVVAIIAILAAIAVPNFLEAQVRAKISRAENDMRTLAVALEAYRVDNNAYIPHRNDRWEFNPLTSPIAYITSVPQCPFAEIFNNREDLFGINAWNYHMENLPEHITGWGEPGSTFARNLYNQGKLYIIWSMGPDLVVNIHTVGLYDATNGTRSDGDLYRAGP
ncbi:MAG TPA: prepilin-type N-terminal cleavage/methylation domain-containing protein [Sumerlaeia bacterium]|nr:prepilin-type N-terminal cleavage/methylation domain-containing protein [Sumerlaeia bacterium]